MIRRGRRRFQRGQSVTEFAIAAPVLILLLLGAFDLTNLSNDLITAQEATRTGARVASILGGQTCVPAGSLLTELQVDDEIASDVRAVASRIVYGTITAVYIYTPAATNGVFNAGTDKYARYNATGARVSSSFSTTVPYDRNQIKDAETSVGVELDWTFRPPTGVGSPTLNFKEYSVFKAETVLNPPPGC